MKGRGLMLIAGVVVVSWAAPLIRLATEAPPVTIAFWRTAIASVALAPLALRRAGELRGLRRPDRVLLASSGALLALHFGTWVASLDMTSVAASVLLVTSSPVWVALASAVLGRRLPRTAWAGIALAVLGASFVAGGGLGSRSLSGNAMALTGAVAHAGYLLAGEDLRRRLSTVAYVWCVYSISALILFAAALVSGASLAGFDGPTWAAIIALGVGPQLIGHTIFNHALVDVEAWKVAATVMGEPLGSTLIAAVVLGEVPGLPVWTGGILLLVGIGLAAGSSEVTRGGR